LVFMSVLVSNLSPELEEHHLRELFECCGQISSMRIKPLGHNERVCTINFDDPTHAQAAASLTGTPLGDRELTVVIRKQGYQEDEPPPQIDPEQIFAINSSKNLSETLMDAARKRDDEIARTVYVGNLALDVDAPTLKKYFSPICGPVLYVKLAGDTFGRTGRFAFLEFDDLEGAAKAMTMSGALLGGRPIKVGKSNNPIFKPGGAGDPRAEQRQKSLEDIMSKIKEHAVAVGKKVESRTTDTKGRNQSRSRHSKSKHKRNSGSKSRSRSRGRRHSRSRSRSRSRSVRRRHSHSRSRSRSGRREPPPTLPLRKPRPDRTGMFFDGYSWVHQSLNNMTSTPTVSR